MMHRGHEHFEILGLVKKNNPHFFMSMMDVPFNDSAAAIDHYEQQLKPSFSSRCTMSLAWTFPTTPYAPR